MLKLSNLYRSMRVAKDIMIGLGRLIHKMRLGISRIDSLYLYPFYTLNNCNFAFIHSSALPATRIVAQLVSKRNTDRPKAYWRLCRVPVIDSTKLTPLCASVRPTIRTTKDQSHPIAACWLHNCICTDLTLTIYIYILYTCMHVLYVCRDMLLVHCRRVQRTTKNERSQEQIVLIHISSTITKRIC